MVRAVEDPQRHGGRSGEYRPRPRNSVRIFAMPNRHLFIIISNSVDRLIKASKMTQKPSRKSSSGSPSSHMFASSSSIGLDQLAHSNSKLLLAQNELQACEAHLSERESALSHMRESIVMRGLKGRCKAMMDCGWKWNEMGKESLRALDNLGFGNQSNISELIISLSSCFITDHNHCYYLIVFSCFRLGEPL